MNVSTYSRLIALTLGCSLFGACASVKQQDLLLAQQSEQLAHILANQEILETQQTEIHQLNQAVTDLGLGIETLERQLIRVNSAINKGSTTLATATMDTIESTTKASKKKGDQAPNLKPKKATLGRVEWAKIELVDKYLKARIDTGAKSSSLHATNVQFFERDGESWVKFQIHTHEKWDVEDVAEPEYEARLVKTTKIKQASADEIEERAVVKLMVSVGEIKEEVTFTLTDRANMNYPVLLGRNFLNDIVVVDVSKVFTRKRQVKAPDTRKKAL